MANVKLKLIERDGSPAGEAEVEDFYAPPDAVIVDDDVFVSTVPGMLQRERIPRDKLEYRRVGRAVRAL